MGLRLLDASWTAALVGRDFSLRRRRLPRHRAFGHCFVGFQWVRRKNELVGCRLKEANQEPTAHSQKLQGVQLDLPTGVAVIAPTAKRMTKLAKLSTKHIDAGKVSPSDAGSFAVARQHTKLRQRSTLKRALIASLQTFPPLRAFHDSSSRPAGFYRSQQHQGVDPSRRCAKPQEWFWRVPLSCDGVPLFFHEVPLPYVSSSSHLEASSSSSRPATSCESHICLSFIIRRRRLR